MEELLTDMHFTFSLLVLAFLFGVIGLLEIKRRNKYIGYVLLYVSSALLFVDLMIIFYTNYEPASLRMIIRY